MNAQPDVSGGGYRFSDLVERRIVSSRGDLSYKQRHHQFPRPVKLGTGPRSGALFLRSEVDAWLAGRVKLRDQAAA